MVSRSTFQPRSDVAWQRQIRDQRATEGLPAGLDPLISLAAARVRPVSVDIARHVIERYEWLGTMSKTTHHFGIFFGVHCGGVVCYATYAAGGYRVPDALGVGAKEFAVLARGA